MHRCLPSREEGPVDDCRQERAHTSSCPAGLVCRLMTFPITTAADSTGGHPGAVAAAPDSSRTTTWQEPLVYPDRREAQTVWTSLPFLCVILAVAVYTCGSVARARSCACLTSKARSTNNHAVYTPPDVFTEIKNTSRTGPKSGGLAAINIATLRPALDEVRVPPGPPTGGEPAYGIKPWPSQGGKVAGGATPRHHGAGTPYRLCASRDGIVPPEIPLSWEVPPGPHPRPPSQAVYLPQLESHSAAPALLCHPSDGRRRSSAPRFQKSTPSRGRQGQKGRQHALQGPKVHTRPACTCSYRRSDSAEIREQDYQHRHGGTQRRTKTCPKI